MLTQHETDLADKDRRYAQLVDAHLAVLDHNQRLSTLNAELLSILKDLLTWDDGNLPGNLMDIAQRTIAKAEGNG